MPPLVIIPILKLSNFEATILKSIQTSHSGLFRVVLNDFREKGHFHSFLVTFWMSQFLSHLYVRWVTLRNLVKKVPTQRPKSPSPFVHEWFQIPGLTYEHTGWARANEICMYKLLQTSGMCARVYIYRRDYLFLILRLFRNQFLLIRLLARFYTRSTLSMAGRVRAITHPYCTLSLTKGNLQFPISCLD